VRVTVLFFGLLRDVTGRSREVIEIAEGSRIQDIYDEYTRQFPRLAALSASIVPARNQQFSRYDAALADGDEVAFLPPVSGGSSLYTHEIAEEGQFYALTRQVIDTRALPARLLRGEDGAVVVFEGVVRNNTKGRPTLFLDYECYEPMAITVLAQIGRELASENPIGGIAMVHRLGRMNIGETSVAVAVTAPHRKPAFEAALEGINRLKRMVPIWKKEYFADGEVWVEGEWDDSVVSR
jgi:molybdopterin synthase catalytic subunit